MQYIASILFDVDVHAVYQCKHAIDEISGFNSFDSSGSRLVSILLVCREVSASVDTVCTDSGSCHVYARDQYQNERGHLVRGIDQAVIALDLP